MGELEEKETTPAASSPQQEVAEEPKETDKMLDKKDDNNASEAAANGSPTESGGAAAASASPSTGVDKKDKKKSSKPNTPIGDKKSTPNDADDAGTTKKVNGGEEIIDIPENGGKSGDDVGAAAGEEKKISTEDREVKPKKIPIGGLKLPGFFMKSKPKGGDADGADGELLEKENKEEVVAEGAVVDAKSKKDEKPRSNFGERLRNFFVRKPAAEKQAKQQQTANGDADTKSEATAEASPADGNESTNAGNDAPPQKRGLLNAIKLPIANMIPKKKSENDVEMGLGGKAGLASMETLDDSLKDQDCVDKAPAKNGTELKKSASADIKQATADEKASDEPVQSISLIDRIRLYSCSVDDALIALGVILFILLLAVIGYVLTHESLTSPPLRDGRFMDAVTGCGPVEGLTEDGAFTFRGIPFAVAPINEHRWRPAKVVDGIDECWNGTLKAHNSSALCTQRLGNGTIVGDEDCLYLDVVTPHVRYKNLLPVVVLIGADTLTGPSPGILRPSARYARLHDVIFVRPNFRLGAFGFLALETLTKSSYPHTSGNYALSDILAALKWIQLNIHHFGGDPKSVVLLGHRAGATLVSALVTSKTIEDLYARAWVSSSSAIFPGKPLAESEKRNQDIMQALDCRDVQCLRGASIEQIWAATPDTWLHFPADIPTLDENATNHHEWLVLDGDILQEHPADAWKKEHIGEPKLVIGTTAHESHTEALRERFTNWTAEEVRSFIDNSRIGALNLTDEAIKLYNATNYRGLVSLITDIRTICPLLVNARLQPSVPFYVVTQGGGKDKLATVDADILAILGRYEGRTAEERHFVSSMQSLFYYFVGHGKVPQHDPRRRVIELGQDPLPREDHPNCNFWITNDVVPRYARVD